MDYFICSGGSRGTVDRTWGVDFCLHFSDAMFKSRHEGKSLVLCPNMEKYAHLYVFFLILTDPTVPRNIRWPSCLWFTWWEKKEIINWLNFTHFEKNKINNNNCINYNYYCKYLFTRWGSKVWGWIFNTKLIKSYVCCCFSSLYLECLFCFILNHFRSSDKFAEAPGPR